MMLDIWSKISYMVQLIAACMVFMIPAPKRNFFWQRTAVSATLFILLSYIINSYYMEPNDMFIVSFYWMFYGLLCIGFVWIGLDVTVLQAAYYMICACGMQHIAYDIYLLYQLLGGSNIVIMVLIYSLVYLAAYKLIAMKLPEYGEFTADRYAVISVTTIVLLVWILSIIENSAIVTFESSMLQRCLYRIIDALCCVYVLWVQVNQKEKIWLQKELDGINAAWLQQTKQYQVTSETIESINRKCHDLKHQIHMLRQIEDVQEKEQFFSEIENDIMIYDMALKTGNRALDTVLMEKELLYKNYNIQWSCMADGSQLDFMKLEDIYAIFGNALDNALAAVITLENPQMRVIGVKIVTQDQLLMIQIQNYYEGYLCFEKGFPVTTKKNRNEHGFGIKSIQYTAEKYNGTITIKAEKNIFMLQILIPVPSIQQHF